VYAANNVTNNVSVIDTVTNTVITTVPVGDGPFGLAVSPDGSVVYVANNDTGNNVSVIRTADNTVVATIAAGNDPRGIVFSPDGTRAYVANQGPGAGTPASVSVIDTATRTVIDTFIVSATQYTNIGISPDGRRLYVPDTVGATVHIVDAATGALVATVPIGQFAIAASACGNGNDLLMAGRTFVAQSARAIGCTGASGPVFTGGTMQMQGANFTSNLSVNVQAQGGTIAGDIAGTGGLIKTAPARCC
jgi:YVTN family beta-propeller protein